jgi:hypothetical protein
MQNEGSSLGRSKIHRPRRSARKPKMEDDLVASVSAQTVYVLLTHVRLGVAERPQMQVLEGESWI